MKKRIFLLAALAAGLVLCLTACGETNGDPVTVTLWHVYGGEVNSPMNALVEEFNRTVGQEQGIRVRVDSVSNSGVIHESVLAAAYKDPGAPELPDLFVSYPKTVLALPDENILADYRDYFTDEELEGYDAQFLRDRLRGKEYLPLAYFEGAAPENSYTPAQPYVLNVLPDPRPQDMEPGYLRLFLQTAGADSPRPIKLRQKPSTGEWFLWEYSSPLSGIRIPAAQDPWA